MSVTSKQSCKETPRSLPNHPSWEPATIRKMEAARRKLPLYLFRAWTARSGGDPRLNTSEAITPHAFIDAPKAPKSGHPSVYHLSKTDLIRMIWFHLAESSDVRSEFSSWTQSLNHAISNAAEQGKFGEAAYITMINTEVLFETNSIWFVPDLMNPFQNAYFINSLYHCEYLAHGTITGQGMSTPVHIDDFQHSPLIRNIPPDFWYHSGELPSTVILIKQLSDKYMQMLVRIGNHFGSAFSAAAIVHIFCLARHSTNLWDKNVIPEEICNCILKACRGILPRNWSTFRGIVGNKVLNSAWIVKSFPELQQVIRLQRALGKTSRATRRKYAVGKLVKKAKSRRKLGAKTVIMTRPLALIQRDSEKSFAITLIAWIAGYFASKPAIDESVADSVDESSRYNSVDGSVVGSVRGLVSHDGAADESP